MASWRQPLPEITDAPRAAAASRKLLDAGVDASSCSRLRLAAPAPDGAIQAAVSEAHRSGSPSSSIPNSAPTCWPALRGGVDVIAHTTPRSGPWDDAIVTATRVGARR